MKKTLLISTMLCLPAMVANAESPSCVKTDSTWCQEHGYVQGQSNCNNYTTQIKCPFDDSYIFCQSATHKDCAIGDILWSDDKCYDANTPPSGKTMKAIVVDPVNKLAVGFDEGDYKWQNGVTEHYPVYNWGEIRMRPSAVPGKPRVNYCYRTDAEENLMYVCHNPLKITTYTPARPPAAEMASFIDNEISQAYALEHPGLALVVMDVCPTTYGCNIRGVSNFRDEDDMYDATNNPDPRNPEARSHRTTSPYNGGWADTFAMVAALSGTTMNTPAAEFCFNKNKTSSTNPITGQTTTTLNITNGHAWFLPSAGDMIQLVENADKINEVLAANGKTTLTPGRSYWTSSQAWLHHSHDGVEQKNSFGAWFGRPVLTEEQEAKIGTNSPENGVPYRRVNLTFNTASRLQDGSHDNRYTRCFYHYGDWDLNMFSRTFSQSANSLFDPDMVMSGTFDPSNSGYDAYGRGVDLDGPKDNGLN